MATVARNNFYRVRGKKRQVEDEIAKLSLDIKLPENKTFSTTLQKIGCTGLWVKADQKTSGATW